MREDLLAKTHVGDDLLRTKKSFFKRMFSSSSVFITSTRISHCHFTSKDDTVWLFIFAEPLDLTKMLNLGTVTDPIVPTA